MSAPNDFSRRFFADFIASRIKARGMEKDGSRSPRRPGTVNANNPPRTVSEPASAESRPAATGSDPAIPCFPA